MVRLNRLSGNAWSRRGRLDRGCGGHRLKGCAMHRADPRVIAEPETHLYVEIVPTMLPFWEYREKVVTNFTPLR